jgi:protein-S-isoprenylcysteine O-methyltransferase Ste14
MINADPHLVVRGAGLYFSAVLSLAVWLWRRPAKRQMAGVALAFAWNLPALLLLHVAAVQFGWWHFEVQGGVLLGIPVDLYLEWAWLWAALPALTLSRVPLVVVAIIALAFDMILMPLGSPVIRLGPAWLTGEAVGLGFVLVPGQLLARWTAEDRQLRARVLLQVLAFAGLMLFLLPAIVLDGSGTSWVSPLQRPLWQLGLFIQLAMLPAVFGLTAVQEFVTRGAGTPVPFDPPVRLVTSGVYAYVANPMQLAAVVLLLCVGVMLENAWLSAAGVMAHLYSIGLAGWREDEDLKARFGIEWSAYRRAVRPWVPGLRPWQPANQPPAILFVGSSCEVCRGVAQWFADRRTVGLSIVAAETHPSGALQRVTYQPADGTSAVAGIEAIARALEHIHLGWAWIGFLLRLPIVAPVVQVLVDASGGQPSLLTSRPAATDFRARSTFRKSHAGGVQGNTGVRQQP